jgi:hypothetical protein
LTISKTPTSPASNYSSSSSTPRKINKWFNHTTIFVSCIYSSF